MNVHDWQIKPVDNVCDGREFCICNGENKSDSVEEMENMVKRHGGRIVKYPGLTLISFIFIKSKFLYLI